MKQDITLKCKDCGAKFTFFASDQDYYQQKGYENPKRCEPCRKKNKAIKNKRKEIVRAEQQRKHA